MMQIEQLRERLRAHDARPVHEQAELKAWVHGLPLDSGRRRPEDFLPASLREALPGLAGELRALASMRSEHLAEDSSSRLLVGLADGQTVESVLLPRDGVCISPQAAPILARNCPQPPSTSCPAEWRSFASTPRRCTISRCSSDGDRNGTISPVSTDSTVPATSSCSCR
jgi:hypothetical protein